MGNCPPSISGSTPSMMIRDGNRSDKRCVDSSIITKYPRTARCAVPDLDHNSANGVPREKRKWDSTSPDRPRRTVLPAQTLRAYHGVLFLSFRFPVKRVVVDLDLALDGVAAQVAVVLDGEFVAVSFDFV